MLNRDASVRDGNYPPRERPQRISTGKADIAGDKDFLVAAI